MAATERTRAPATAEAAISALFVAFDEAQADNDEEQVQWRIVEPAIRALRSAYSPDDHRRLVEGRINDLVGVEIPNVCSELDGKDVAQPNLESVQVLIELAHVCLQAADANIERDSDPLGADTIERFRMLASEIRYVPDNRNGEES